MRDGAVEEEVFDKHEVRGSNACKGVEMRWIFVISPFPIYYFTKFTIKNYEKNLSPLILLIFPIFPRPGSAASLKRVGFWKDLWSILWRQAVVSGPYLNWVCSLWHIPGLWSVWSVPYLIVGLFGLAQTHSSVWWVWLIPGIRSVP